MELVNLKNQWFCSLFILLALYSCSGWAQDLAELEVDHALTFEFATPHVKWATPYSLGKTRVLFFTNGMGTWPRECIESMQRFDLETKAVFYVQIVDNPAYHWHGGALGEKRMADLLDQPWDCFVFLDIDSGKMPMGQRAKMMTQVEKGAGLVLSGLTNEGVLPKKSQFTAMPALLTDIASGSVKPAVYELGLGRGVQMEARPEIPYAEGWLNEYEAWQEKLGRAILWAGGKEPRMEVVLSLPDGLWVRESANNFKVALNGLPIGKVLKLRSSLRGLEGVVKSWPEQSAQIGRELSFTVPTLGEGRYHLDVQVVSERGVETWLTRPVRVVSDNRIQGITLDRDWGDIGDRISGSIEIADAGHAGDILDVCLLDTQRRILSKQPVKMVASESPSSRGQMSRSRLNFSFDIAPWLPMLTTVEARLSDKSGLVSSAYQYLHVTKRNRDRFNFLMWDVPKGTLAPYAEEMLSKTGVTLQLAWGNPPPLWPHKRLRGSPTPREYWQLWTKTVS